MAVDEGKCEPLEWRIYYVDGSTFSSLDGLPADAPGGGIAAVVERDEEVGSLIHRGEAFYVYDEDIGWAGMDSWGLAQHLIDPGYKVIKLGRAMPTKLFRAMMMDLRAVGLEKVARYPWEVKDSSHG